MRLLNACLFLTIAAALVSPAAARCRGTFAIEVLGSGGPLADDARASSSYLVWIDGEARLLIDAGGGAFVRFGAAGADMSVLDAIMISHFHADHVSDLAALLKSASFDDDAGPMAIVGPSGGGVFPGLHDFLEAQFGQTAGAYRYLSRLLTGEGDGFSLSPSEIDAFADSAPVVFERDGLGVTAIPVNHGNVPALAYSVSYNGATAVFAGDQSLFSEFFERRLAGTRPDVLIAHHAISGAPGQPRGLHRTPESIGDMAAAMGAKRLVLSHNMKRALDAWRDGRRAIRAVYKERVDLADDGMCVSVAR
jgi:ribonuclease BN (tRNA processing enzyme)